MSAKGKTKAAVLENVIENGKNVKKIFKKIITADSGEYKGDKLEGIKLISKISGIALKNILYVGDKYWVDIEPFIKIGGNGFLVKNPEDIKDLWERLKGMKQYEKSNHNT